MMEQPNLIKRPILIRGSKVTFGFNKDATSLRRREQHPHRHVRLELPLRQGHVERHLLPARSRAGAGRGKFDELAFYAEHFDTVEINSTFYGVPAAATTKRMGGTHARGFRILAEALPEVHAPGDVPQGLGPGSVEPRRRRTWTSSAARSIRWRPRASSARSSRSFRPASRTSPTRADTWSGCSSDSGTTSVAVELRHRSWSDDPAADVRPAGDVRRGVDAD